MLGFLDDIKVKDKMISETENKLQGTKGISEWNLKEDVIRSIKEKQNKKSTREWKINKNIKTAQEKWFEMENSNWE